MLEFVFTRENVTEKLVEVFHYRCLDHVDFLRKFSPKAVETKFSHLSASQVALNFVSLQQNALMLAIVLNAFLPAPWVYGLGQVARGFLLCPSRMCA